MEVVTKAMRDALGLNEDESDMSIIGDIISIKGGSPSDYDGVSTEELNKLRAKAFKDAENKKSGGAVKKKKAGGGKVYRGRPYANGGRVAKYNG